MSAFGPDVATLPNGVRIVADPAPGYRTTALAVWFRAGTMDETPAENGVAHLLEHMAFKGAAGKSARDIAEAIENVGGQLNASTSYQRTGYYARILEDDLDLAFNILADIVLEPSFDAAEIEKEKEVVVQEIGEAADTPDDVVMELLQAKCFGSHALGRPILGTPETVRAQSAASLRRFTGAHYTPARMVVAASGAVDRDRLLRLVEDRFGSKSSRAAVAAGAKPAFVGGAAHDNRDIEQTHIALAFPGYSVREREFYAASVFSEAFGGGMSSRIFQSVREERGLAYSVYSFVEGYYATGLLCAYAGVESESAVEAIALIRAALEDMAHEIAAPELDRARALVKASVLMGLESLSSRSDAAAAHLFAHGRIVPVDEMIAQLDAVTADDLRGIASRALSSPAALSVVGPCDFDAVRRAAGAS